MAKLTEEQYQEILNSRPSLWKRVKGFFYHIHMVLFAQHDISRFRYLDAVKQFEERRAKDKKSKSI